MSDSSKKKAGCLWALVGGQALVIVGLVLLLIVMFVGAMGRFNQKPSKSGLGVDEFPRLEEIHSWGSGDAKVVRISLSGTIFLGETEGFMSRGVTSATMALQAIRRATHDPQVRALIVDIDSGGGGVTASDILYKALQDFKQAGAGRKVIAIFGDVAASGAYYLSMAADHVMARPTSITGSIGVLMQSINVKELAAKIGIDDVTIKSAEYKDLLNPFNDLSDAQQKLLQGIVDELYGRFVDIVADGRGLPREKVLELADGQILTAQQALKANLVDEIGYWSDAVERVAAMIDEEEVSVYRYQEQFSLSALLRGSSMEQVVRGALDEALRTRVQYKWEL